MRRAINKPIAAAQPDGVAPALDDATLPSTSHDEWLLDESLRETFPASDPIAPASSPKPNDVSLRD
jgi:hypothetical protein